MAMVLKYRGRSVDDADVGFIQNLIQAHPEASRRQLSEKLCAAWNWVQGNGAPCDMICRGLMLALDRGGHIYLPPVKITPHNPFLRRRSARDVAIARYWAAIDRPYRKFDHFVNLVAAKRN